MEGAMRPEEEIQQYLDDKLQGEALKKFETALETDRELAQEVAELQDTEESLRAAGYDAFKLEVQQWERDYRAKKRRNWLPYLAIAASIAVAIVASVMLFRDTSLSPDQLFALHFEPYEDMILVRDPEIDPDLRQLADGMEAYNEKRYAEAEKLLAGYIETHPSPDQTPVLYLAIAQTVTGNYSNAETNFMELLNDDRLGQQAQWYLSLMYLKNNQPEAAKKIIQQIKDSPGHYKRQEADQIDESLR
jgi:hypothetical protein